MPEALLQKHGRIDCSREHGPRHGLGQVVEPRELIRRDLEVDLEAGVAGLEHHALARRLQLVDALDQRTELTTCKGAEHLVQLGVARMGRHVVEREVLFRQRGQDARQHDVSAQVLGRSASRRDAGLELFLHRQERAGGESPRRQVGLDVEGRELGREELGVQLGQHLGRHASGSPALVHQEELLLGADPLDAGLDHPGVDHPLQGLHVVQEGAREVAQPTLIQSADVLLTHGPTRSPPVAGNVPRGLPSLPTWATRTPSILPTHFVHGYADRGPAQACLEVGRARHGGRELQLHRQGLRLDVLGEFLDGCGHLGCDPRA